MNKKHLLTDYIISRVRTETGLWFDVADAYERVRVSDGINVALLTDGESFASINIFPERYASETIPIYVFETLGETFKLLLRFSEDSRRPLDDDAIRTLVVDAVARFSTAESPADSVSLICMEMHGKSDAGLSRWATEAAGTLGGVAGYFPEYNGKMRDLPSFHIDKPDGKNWAQIRLNEPRSSGNVAQTLRLHNLQMRPQNTCCRYDVDQQARDAFGIDRVYLKFRVF